MVKTKGEHHHCPASVYMLMKSEAVLEIHRWGFWLLKWGVGGRGGGGEPLVLLPSTCGLMQAMRPGQCTSTILQVSLSPSPPSSVSQQAWRRSMKQSALYVRNTPSLSHLFLSYLSISNPSISKPSVLSPWSVWLLK
jgi:hypothetical protein